MKNLKIWNFIKSKIVLDHRVILSIVVESKGSSPGRQGFKLVITKDDTLGTIGGGIMESNIIELGRELIENSKKDPILKELLHYRNAEPAKRSGLMCSGSQQVVLIQLDRSQKALIDEIIISYSNKAEVSIEVANDRFNLIEEKSPYKFEKSDDESFRYTERVGFPHTVYIFGAGHVGSAISKTLELLDFKIVLIDRRNSLPDLDRFYHEIHQTEYSQVDSLVQVGERSYVLVVTSDREGDQEVLIALKNKSYRYIGLMGSKTKIKSIFTFLRSSGVSEKFISSIQAPIGIGIPNESPEEIGISVTAQLIEKRYS